jgi:hypothetical protein
MLTNKARALAAAEATSAAQQDAASKLTEAEIQTEIHGLRKVWSHATEEVLRAEALWRLTVCYPLLNQVDTEVDLFAPLDSFQLITQSR